MSKQVVLAGAIVGVLGLAGMAFADAKTDAQAKVDAAKTEVCEKGKKFLGEQEAKGKCAAESGEAKKITCSAATSKTVTDLQTKCITAKPAAKPTDKPADKPAEPVAVAGTKCRALDVADSKKVIAEADDKSSIKCTTLLTTALKKQWCTADNKGKKFEYMSDFDHMIGTGKTAAKVKGKQATITCITVAK